MNETIQSTIDDKVLLGLNEYETYPIDSKERRVLLEETVKLETLRREAEHEENERIDKEKRREIEKLREENAIEIEKIKQSITWKKAGLEILKVAVIPVTLKTLEILAYGKFQHINLMFEKDGIIKSKTARELNLPKFLR